MEKKKSVVLAIFIFLAGINCFAWFFVFDINQPLPLKVVFFDVGQGDAIFIETFKKTQILIDGGPGKSVVEKLGQELPFFDRSLDLIILTHPDSDHSAGLAEVLKSYQADIFGWSGVKSKDPVFLELEKEIEKDRSRRIVLKKGQKILIGKNLQFQVLAPIEDFEGKEVIDTNTSSLVLRMIYEPPVGRLGNGQNEFLFTGDASKSIEKQLVKNNELLKSDVLKVSHHGSQTSTTEEFLEKVKPEIAVISVGKDNRYGHPAKEVLERLEKYGIKIMRTDERGNIRVFSDGQKIIINTKK